MERCIACQKYEDCTCEGDFAASAQLWRNYYHTNVNNFDASTDNQWWKKIGLSRHGENMEWIKCSNKLPEHMQEVKVYIENPYFGSFERTGNAVYLGFDGNFYDAEEQIQLNYVTKWMPLHETPKD